MARPDEAAVRNEQIGWELKALTDAKSMSLGRRIIQTHGGAIGVSADGAVVCQRVHQHDAARSARVVGLARRAPVPAATIADAYPDRLCRRVISRLKSHGADGVLSVVGVFDAIGEGFVDAENNVPADLC